MARKNVTDVRIPADLKDKATWVCDQLNTEYGVLEWRSHGDPLDALVQTILSQRTTDVNSDCAFDSLRRAFPTWDDVRTAPVSAIQEAIQPGGLSEMKAPRIKAVLQAIHERAGATNLNFLDAMPTEEAKAYLTSFHGVGPKTMACVLMFSLGRPVLPVDTHVFRVSHRVGLIEKRIGEAKAHDALERLLEPERVYPFHVHLIRHGRRVCVAQRPRCGACVLKERCHFYQSGEATIGLKPLTRPVETLHGLPMAK